MVSDITQLLKYVAKKLTFLYLKSRHNDEYPGPPEWSNIVWTMLVLA
jgi:hypothetical protein